MPYWRLTVDLTDIWSDPAGRSPLDRRPEIADRLRESRWPQITSDPRRLDHLLRGLVAENPNPGPEIWWHGLYDLADTDRVWLDTL